MYIPLNCGEYKNNQTIKGDENVQILHKTTLESNDVSTLGF